MRTKYPINQSSYSDWWIANGLFLGSPPLDIIAPLVGLATHNDWLGNEFVMTPPQILLPLLGLTMSKPGKKFEWKAEQEEPIVVLRTWKVRSQQMDSTASEIEGMDLLIHPQALTLITQYYSAEIQISTKIISHNIEG